VGENAINSSEVGLSTYPNIMPNFEVLSSISDKTLTIPPPPISELHLPEALFNTIQ